MVTPTTEEIRTKAITLFMRDEYTAAPEDITTPEDYELKEGGYWLQAQHELMRGLPTFKREKMFLENRRAPVSPKDTPQQQHVKLVMALVQLRKRSVEDLITASYAEEWGQCMQQVRNLRGILALEWQIKMRSKKRYG